MLKIALWFLGGFIAIVAAAALMTWLTKLLGKKFNAEEHHEDHREK